MLRTLTAEWFLEMKWERKCRGKIILDSAIQSKRSRGRSHSWCYQEYCL